MHQSRQTFLAGVLTMAVFAIALAGDATAQLEDRYDRCRLEASEISGYRGQESKGFIAGSLRGGLGGAAIGAAGGWVTGNKAKKTAKRGAALGALIGGVRAAAKKRDIEEKRETYERVLERCMARDG
jgi:hypothetical protein